MALSRWHTADRNVTSLTDLFEYAYSDLNPSIPDFLPSDVKFDPCVPDMAPEKRALEFSTGALAGEYYAKDHDNLYYLSGWMAMGFVLVLSDVADVRDFFASVILKEDAANIALNGVVVLIDVASYLGLFTIVGAIPGDGQRRVHRTRHRIEIPRPPCALSHRSLRHGHGLR